MALGWWQGGRWQQLMPAIVHYAAATRDSCIQFGQRHMRSPTRRLVLRLLCSACDVACLISVCACAALSADSMSMRSEILKTITMRRVPVRWGRSRRRGCLTRLSRQRGSMRNGVAVRTPRLPGLGWRARSGWWRLNRFPRLLHGRGGSWWGLSGASGLVTCALEANAVGA